MNLIMSKEEKAPKAYLNFEGVDSCFYVWMNGQLCRLQPGVPLLPAEFDVTEFHEKWKKYVWQYWY